MIAAALLVLFLIAAMGSCAYVAYRAKQRIDKVQQAYKKDDFALAWWPRPQGKPASPSRFRTGSQLRRNSCLSPAARYLCANL